MSAVPPMPPLADLEPADQFLVGYGKSGAVGVFLAPGPIGLRRGTPVVLQTARGTEWGTVLGPATRRQARLLGAVSSGDLMRRATPADEAHHAELVQRAHEVFETSRALVVEAGLSIEILDVDLLFDGRVAIVQYVGTAESLDDLARELERRCELSIRLEDLATPHAEEHAGCDKPDCGRAAGGCSTCATGGGCSSCGTGKVDMRDYFAHLRTQMEARRTPLL